MRARSSVKIATKGTSLAMIKLFIHWLLSAIALIITAEVIPSFEVQNFSSAMVAALVIGLLNATIGFLLKIVTFPISILTLGLFLLVINALMIMLASNIVKGFHVRGFFPAFLGAAILAVLGIVIRSLLHEG